MSENEQPQPDQPEEANGLGTAGLFASPDKIISDLKLLVRYGITDELRALAMSTIK